MTFDPFAGGAIEASVDTTEAQREIWLAVQMGGPQASLAYNESISLVVGQRLDGARLRHALTELLRRHQALRGTFNSDGTTLVVNAEPDLQLEERDLQAGAPDRHKAECAQIRRDEVSRPFDLVHGPLVRFVRILLPEGREELVITAHHLVCDGWSFGVLVTELGALYEGRTLPPAPSFAEHAAEARRALYGPEAEATEVYWVGTLGRDPGVLDLPTDRPRTAAMATVEGIPTRDLAATRVDRVLEPDLVQPLDRLAKQRGVGMSALMLAAFAALMRRLSGQDDFCIGVPAAAQAHTGAYGLVGHCVQMLPIRVRCPGDPAVPDVAKAVKTSLLDGFERQTLTFGSLLQRLKLERDPSRVPLIPVMFNLDQEFEVPQIGGAAARLVSNPRVAENFEIFLNITPEQGRLTLEATFRTGLFEPATVADWLESYEALLRGVVAEPDGASGRLPCVSDGQREQQLHEWNATAVEFGRSTPLARILAQAAARPDRIAVHSDGQQLTYGGLAARSASLARALEDAGVGPGHRVGVAHGRTADLVAALLAVWRLGAAYVPLDPEYPPERLAYVLQDSGARVVLGDAAEAPAFLGDRRYLRTDRVPVDAPGDDGGAAGASPDGLAYVIHTSGSTGTPKGVAVEHAAVDNFLMAMAQRPGLGADDVLVAVTALSFDISVLELFLPLVVGAQVVVAGRDDVRDAARLGDLLSSVDASVLQATPSGWRALLDSGWQGKGDLKALCGGEALPPDLARGLRPVVASLWNMYGPTEATVWSTVAEVEQAEGPITLGRPIANTTAYVLDEHLALLPPGSAAGELHLGGAGLARGYLGLPELTAERFVPDPFAPQDSARLYRTGDRVRCDGNGDLHYLGRTDFQVKIRGFRIELGEVEACVQQHPTVHVAAAAVREFGPGDQRLVAWLVPAGRQPVDLDGVRALARDTLPPQAVPQHFVQVAELPMTANRKVDRKALPMPEGAGAVAAGRAPEGETEERLASMWMQLLRLDDVGADADFFLLGGHSLLAARMLTRIEEGWGVRLPLQAVFQYPTIAGLAQAVESAAYQERATQNGDGGGDGMEELRL